MASTTRDCGKRKAGGYVLFTATVAMAALCGFMALALDLGYFELKKRRMQTAADAAALSAAWELKKASGAALAAARNDAALNGFPDGVNGTVLTLNIPPASGYYAGDNYAAEVILSQQRPTFFAAMLNLPAVTVRARAVARLGNGAYCIYALNPSARDALVAGGTSTVQAQCGIAVNSSNAEAIDISGRACVSATAIDVVGGFDAGSNCPPSPSPTAGVDPVQDPLAYLQPPVYGGCNYTDYRVGGGITTLNPGVYCGGIRVNAGAMAYLNPGTYVLYGGGLTVSGGANIQGQGVMFYNTEGPGYRYDAITITGTTNTRLSAPASGPYAGVLFFQDRSIISSQTNILVGGGTTLFEGALYFPTSPLRYSGGSSMESPAYTLIVADTIRFTGNSFLKIDFTGLPGGSPFRTRPVLGE